MPEAPFSVDGLYLNFFSNVLVVLAADQLLHTLLLFVVVLALCLALRGRHPRMQLALWALVCLRPLIPAQWHTAYNLRELATGLFPQLDALSALFQLTQLDLAMLLSAPVFVDHPFITWSMAIVATWLAAGAVFIWRLFRARGRYWRAVRASTPVRSTVALELLASVRQGLRIRRRVRLVAGTAVASPFTIGTLAPVIFIPEPMLRSLDRGALLTLLAHEMAHIKRCDDLWGVLLALVQRVFFFFPVFWFVRRQWEEQREIVCDGLAIKCSRQSAGDYAAGLFSIVHYFRNREAVGARTPVPGLSLRHRGYRARLLALRDYSLPCARESALVLGGILLVVVFVMPMHSPEASSVALRERSRAVLPTPLDKLTLPVGRDRILAGFTDIPVNAPLGLGTLEFVHAGLDIRLPAGTNIVAMGHGVVVGVVDRPVDGIARRTGGYVSIRHDNGVLASYHYVGLSPLRVGQRVAAGERIGRLLANKYSPRVFPRHSAPGSRPPARLHISMSYRGIAIDPEQVIEFSGP